jgi:Flp pilus assembly pilin Flp
LIAAIIAVGLILAFTVFRDELSALFGRQSDALQEH